MPAGNGKSFGRRLVGVTGLLALTLLAVVGCRTAPTADRASRTEVLAYLRKVGAYQPATTRVRKVEWYPEMREWLVSLQEADLPLSTELAVNATATAHRDDTCRL